MKKKNFFKLNKGVPFIFTVKTDNTGTSNDNEFTIPITTGTYKYSVSTSDGQYIGNVTSGTTITFPVAGTYDIEITGIFPKIYFNNTGDKEKIISVNQWGNYGLKDDGDFETNQSSAFYGCSNLISISDDVDNINLITNGSFMFRQNQLTSLPTGMELPLLTNGSAMFFQNQLTSLPTEMELPLLTNGASMFFQNQLTSLYTNMNLPLLTNGSFMFRQNQLTSLPTGMELPLLTNGSSMFYQNQLTSLPTGMELPLLTNGANMFQGNQLTSLPTGMELPLLTTGNSMFFQNQLTSLPTGMELPLLTNGASMFYQNQLTSLPTGMELPLLTNGSAMFYQNQLTSLPTGMELPLLSNGANMFFSITIDKIRYSQLLVDLEIGNSNSNIVFHGGLSKYNTTGQTARNLLIARGWVITDGGFEI